MESYHPIIVDLKAWRAAFHCGREPQRQEAIIPLPPRPPMN